MPGETYLPPGGVGSAITRPTTGEATGSGGLMLRNTPTILADKTRFLDDATGNVTEPAQTAPTLLNSWAAAVAVGFYLARNGRVHLKGVVTTGTTTTGTVIFTLPVGSRPPATCTYVVPCLNTGVWTTATIQILATGDVTVQAAPAAWLGFDGISFHV